MDAKKLSDALWAMCLCYPACKGCPLYAANEAANIVCLGYVKSHPEDAKDILARWTKDNTGVAINDTPAQPTKSVALGRGEILDKAKECVCQDRNREYGEPEDGFKLIAALWEPVIRERCMSPGAEVDVDPETVALLMALLKVARATTNPEHLDSWVDLAGYAACGGEIACKED